MALTNEQVVAAVKKNPMITGCVVLSILVAAAIYFRSDLIPTATDQLKEKSAEGQRLALNIKNAAQLGEQLQALTEANKEIDTRLVRAGQLANNLQYFYKLEADTGVKLVDLRQVAGAPRTGKEKEKLNYQPVTFNLTVQGPYAQVFDFLRRLESGTHYCCILTSTFTPSTGGNGESNSGGGNGLIRTDSINLVLSLELLGVP
jgi:hypothetical protein